MIATFIPFYILASLSDHLNYTNGPEFRFNASVILKAADLNDKLQFGMNGNFDIRCRPKTNSILCCQLKEQNITGFDINENTGQLEDLDFENDLHLLDPVQFEVEFNEKGIRRIILNKMNRPVPEEIIKAISNLLNVAIYLDKSNYLRIQSDSAAQQKYYHNHHSSDNKCPIENYIVFEEDKSTHNLKLHFNLDSSLKNVYKNGFNVSKSWDLNNCNTFEAPLWSSFIINNIPTDSRSKIIKLDRQMIVYGDIFESTSYLQSQRMKKDKTLVIHEWISLMLEDVQSVGEKWQNIKYPVVISYIDSENDL